MLQRNNLGATDNNMSASFHSIADVCVWIYIYTHTHTIYNIIMIASLYSATKRVFYYIACNEWLLNFGYAFQQNISSTSNDKQKIFKYYLFYQNYCNTNIRFNEVLTH